ncbi:tetratricopeptide repeat protein [Paraburkholderia caribensis]|uniref:Tetratricopeptide repeat protein n=1 Tax=Paraburkholderia caribensis TaxID=75105 RepID=A0A9Q6WQZ4_9BURK|nr:tetratricopeptide repeat protein [Paraburkholderia caribensis]MCO4876230.1 tetratricopeptide repeat protein [Paraburkholderia caribensis]PTB29745.1 hypothetical protein C9I56_05470 [Paraburkholderia caribensis]QLB67429.1 hypothetical protein A9O66_33880 [Paraburkholderia caribensis]
MAVFRKLLVSFAIFALNGIVEASPADSSQTARAEAGGVAVNVNGDGNVVTVSLADPQVKVIVKRLMSVSLRMQKSQRANDETLATLGRQIAEVQRAVATMVAASRQPDDDPAGRAAVDALMTGDTRPSQDFLRRQEVDALNRAGQKGAVGTDGVQAASNFASEQAALLSISNISDALQVYQRAVDYQPDDPWTLMRLGDAQVTAGKTSAALSTFERAVELIKPKLSSSNRYSSHTMAAALLRIGDVLAMKGENKSALDHYQDALNLNAKSTDANVDGIGVMRNRATLYQHMGDIFVQQREYQQAMDAYQTSLSIRQTAADTHSNELLVVLGLSSTCQKVGDLFDKKQDYANALAYYQKAIDAGGKLSSTDADSSIWKANLASIHQRTANVLIDQHKRNVAFDHIRMAVDLRVQLVSEDSANLQWKQELAFSKMKLGDLLFAERNYGRALDAYREAHALYKDVAEADTDNSDRIRWLAVSLRKKGLALTVEGEYAAALDDLGTAVFLDQKLVDHDEGNAVWQTDLALARWRLAAVESGQSVETRIDLLQRSLKALESLQRHNKLAPDDQKYPGMVSRDLSNLMH